MFLAAIAFNSCKKSETPYVIVTIPVVVPPSAFTVTVVDRGTDYAVLNWTKSLANGNDSIIYNVYLGNNPVPVANELKVLSYTFHNLNPDSTYNGRVEAEDSKQNRTSEKFHLDPFDGYFFAYDSYMQRFYKATLSTSPVTPYSFIDDPNTPSGYSYFPIPAINGDTLIASDINAVTAVSVKSGSQLWSIPTPGSPMYSILYNKGIIYAAGVTPELTVVAIDVAKKSIKWTFASDAEEMSSDLVIANNMVYFTNLNTLYALNANTGNVVWSKVVGNALGRPSTDGKSVFVAAQQTTNVSSYDCLTGALNWSTGVGSVPIFSCPVVHNNALLTVLSTGTVALNTQNGSYLWKTAPSGYPAFNGDTVFMQYGSKLHAININSGSEIWASSTNYGVSDAVYAAGNVYFLFSTDATSGPYVTKVATKTGAILMTANRNGSGYFLTDLPPLLLINNQVYYGSTSAMVR